MSEIYSWWCVTTLHMYGTSLRTCSFSAQLCSLENQITYQENIEGRFFKLFILSTSPACYQPNSIKVFCYAAALLTQFKPNSDLWAGWFPTLIYFFITEGSRLTSCCAHEKVWACIMLRPSTHPCLAGKICNLNSLTTHTSNEQWP